MFRMHFASLVLTPHVLALALLIGSVALAAAWSVEGSEKPAYPPARRAEVVDELHGVKVADPYRWMEDLDSEETTEWVEAENRLTFERLAKIPARDRIRKRLAELWNFERYGVPFREGGHYFFEKNNGLQNQAVLLVADRLEGEPRVLIDPNTLSKDGTVALAGYSPSRDGRWLAYALAEAGSDWNVWKVRDVATGQDRVDRLEWSKFSGAAWTSKSSGFYYSRFRSPRPGDDLKAANRGHQIFFHRLGTTQDQDVLVYERPDHTDWYLHGQSSDDGQWLLITAFDGTQDREGLFVKDLARPEAPVRELIASFDAHYSWVDNVGSRFLVKTDLQAPNGRVVAVELESPARENWKSVVPEAADALQEATVVGEKLFGNYLKDAKTLVRVFALDGTPAGEVSLPGMGTAEGFGGRRTESETFYSFTGFTTPTTTYRYDVASGRTSVFRQPRVDFDSSGYETKQVFYASQDGTRVPMFLVHRRGLALDGSNPTLLYGYGGFKVPVTPAFKVSVITWLELGGVYAVANLRGGSEYGEAWHEAGTKARKQNVFDDFIAAAEWLIASRYTRPEKLAVMGGSNGGLLVGAVVNQRPELFGAALPAVGVMDMLRFHKFTVGWGWVGDYGSPDNPDDFKALLAYSPYHNLKRGRCHPPTLVTTADHDDRVYPAHSFKYAAALQWAQGCEREVLIRIETRAGHGAGKPVTKSIEEAADIWAFLTSALKMAPPTP